MTLLRDTAGSVVIETAFVVPVLAILALGGFEASRVVSREVELQTAASEAAAIVLANPPDEYTERRTLKAIVQASTKLSDNNVTLEMRYRCGSNTNLVLASTDCVQTDVISEFLVLTMRDRYTPIWADFGIGDPIDFRVRRRVQIS